MQQVFKRREDKDREGYYIKTEDHEFFATYIETIKLIKAKLLNSKKEGK